MIRKILITTFFLISFSTLASASETPEVLYSTITQSEAETLHILIPPSTTVGFKSLSVDISGLGKVHEVKTIYFCKDTFGVIHWDNMCPDLNTSSDQATLEAAKSRGALPPYNPLSNPRRTTDTAVIAFAALAVATGAGALSIKIGDEIQPSSQNQQGYIAGLSEGTALIASSALGPGDRAQLWQKPATQRIDNFFTRSAINISGFSPLMTRVFSDGNYLRSLFGPFSLIIYPCAIGLGIQAAISQKFQALPPSLFLILLMMGIGVIDALAGLLAGLAFALSVLIGGYITSLDAGLTVVGVSILAFSPAILASAFRPLRRPVWDFTSLWERMTDYALASILTGWVVEQIVLGLPGLSGLQLPLTVHAGEIGLWAAGFIVLRFGAEDFSLQLFPNRLNKLEPTYRERSIFQQVLAAFFKITIFAVIAGKYLGLSIELIIGVSLFSLPLIMGIFEDRFPKSQAIQKWMPTGIIEMLTMTIAGFLLAKFVQSRYPNAQNYVLISFVLLSLPGLILKILELFGEEGAPDWRVTKVGAKVYRIAGVLVLGTLIYIVLSGLLLSNHV